MNKHAFPWLILALLAGLAFPPHAAAQGITGEPQILCSQDFETLPCFTQDFSAVGWEAQDGDGDETYMIVASREGETLREYAFAGCREPMSFLVFNPDKTTPAITPMQSQNYDKLTAHGGAQCAVSFASKTKANDDTLTSPAFVPLPKTTLSFYVKGFLAASGEDVFTESYEVLAQLESGEKTVIWEGAAPTDGWQEVKVDLSAYAGSSLRLIFHYKAQNAFLFMLDDIVVTGEYAPVLIGHNGGALQTRVGDAPQALLPELEGAPDGYVPVFTYETQDEGIASVDQDGVVSPVHMGNTVITVTEAGTGLVAKIPVSVLAVTVAGDDRPLPNVLRRYFLYGGAAVLVILVVVLGLVLPRVTRRGRKAPAKKTRRDR
ncbi:MAG: choice-of-anchor J domain-containing protein [Eubacteriales bacterium]|nr:choice-of-anchor J domain-containing protein [Eubacteriales bacterium]